MSRQDYKQVVALFGNFDQPWKRHCRLVALISMMIARNITDSDERKAFYYGLAHDIGKSTDRSQLDPRYHCVDGFLILQDMGYDDLKMSALTHSFPDLTDISLVPGYYNPLWDPDIKDKNGIIGNGIWDSFIPSHLMGHKQDIYDIIVNLADLMSAGDRIVTIEERLQYVRKKYGTSPKEKQTIEAIRRNVKLVENLMGRELSGLTGQF